MADLQGRITLITGATDGIGRATADALARMGAQLVLVGRSAEKGARVVSLMAQVRDLAAAFKARYDRLHVLINNAGAVFSTRQVTREGNEMTLALNHLSYFLLTHLLLEPIQSSGTPERRARIVNVSSGAHSLVRGIDFDNLQREKRYSGFTAYSASKLMNIMFTYELARRLAAENALVTANVLHPGLVGTRFNMNNGAVMRLLTTILRPLSRTPEKGAATTIHLASSPTVETITGRYFVDTRVSGSSRASLDQAAWARLWSVSEALTGIDGSQIG
jgi:NAD(P)-dependent dehydrogenase (short-subunit alcohol dehydrogenase family)